MTIKDNSTALRFALEKLISVRRDLRLAEGLPPGWGLYIECLYREAKQILKTSWPSDYAGSAEPDAQGVGTAREEADRIAAKQTEHRARLIRAVESQEDKP